MLVILGMGILINTVGFMFVLPTQAELSEGYITPIIAFELATTPSDLHFLMGNKNTAIRTAMTQGLVLDAIFPLLYSAFIFVIALKAATNNTFNQHSRTFGTMITSGLWLSALIALLIPLTDWHENHRMQAILTALDAAVKPTDLTQLINQLIYGTWTKWLSIAIAIGLLVPYFAIMRRHFTLAICTLCSASTLAAFALNPMPILGEIMALSVSFFILFFFVEATLDLRKRHAQSLKQP